MGRKPLLFNFLLILFLITGLGCGRSGARRDVIYQTSTLDALLAGVFDGEVTIGELLRHGDHGIGTFNGLDGEMVVNDGRVYQVRADGSVQQVDSSIRTPFASIKYFRMDQMVEVTTPVDFAGLREMLDGIIPSTNHFHAIRIRGYFRHIRTRSVPPQEKPYPRLVEVTRMQPEFDYEDVSGILIGFRLPDSIGTLNVPGYHLHFLSDDLKKGGHLLEMELVAGLIEVDHSRELFLVLNDSTDFQEADLTGDRSGELREAEE